jgi:N-methylhydantoinase B
MAAIDPITLEIVTEALISVVREMRATVFRTARSVAIAEARDFSCGLFAADSQVVAQSEDIGAHVVPLPWSVRAALEDFGDDLAPGDVVVLNDPYRGGTHLNDVTLIYPVFHEGRLTFFPAVREHWADVGGMVPGSMSGSARTIYQEGVRIPPIKIVEAGRLNKAAMQLLMANMRVPREREGDFNSGLAGCWTAERRIREIIGRYGLELVEEVVQLNLSRSEARMRACIGRLSDGEYYYEDYLETFDEDKRFEPLLLPLRLTVAGEELTADFTGASPQAPAPVNSTAAVTTASVFITLKSVFDPAVPMNQGSFRPIKVVAPERTILNVQHPAPAGSHGEVRKRVIAVMLGALSQVAPDRISGDIHRTSFQNMLGGHHSVTRREYVHYEWSSGGNGGLIDADGASAMAAIDWGDLSTVQSSEVLETRYPLRVEFSRLGIGSAGDGRHRGGLGMRRGLRLLDEEATYSLLSDGAVVPPFGVLGGMSASPVDSYVRRKDQSLRFDTPGKVGGFSLRRDDVLVLQSAGGGGYGDPLEREPNEVMHDLREGYVTAKQAEAVYGVVPGKNGAWDEAATSAKRAEIAGQRTSLTAVADDREPYRHGTLSRRRICRLSPADANRLGLDEGDMLEMVGRGGAPLRAWTVVDPAVASGAVPLDTLAANALGVETDGSIWIRALRLAQVT